jgi:hypothetical protein
MEAAFGYQLEPAGSTTESRPDVRITQEEYYRRLIEWVDNKRKTNALLRYYLHIDPYALDLRTWAMRVIELQWVREEEANTKIN